ncbi:MAG TPA: hypothetical protein VF712_13865 [Thermoleophilaceae bacterium]|jgi:hypothetical protein
MADPETFASRRADYENFAQRSQWLAGGVVAVLAVAAQLFQHGSHVLGAALLTSALLAGASSAYARVEFAWAISELELARQRENADIAASLRSTPAWPTRAENLMVVALVLLALAGALLIIFVWEIAL